MPFLESYARKKENTGFGSIFWFILNLPTSKNPPKKVPSFFLGCEWDKNIRWLYPNSFSSFVYSGLGGSLFFSSPLQEILILKSTEEKIFNF
jgi:hypothetical protein